jgi:hypothetical protein
MIAPHLSATSQVQNQFRNTFVQKEYDLGAANIPGKTFFHEAQAFHAQFNLMSAS